MILKFINRKTELDALEKAYLSPHPEFFVIYGRRRIGKTELMKRFTEKKSHFYFLAKKQDLELEREEFQRKFAEKFNMYLEASPTFEALFKQILGKINLKKKFVIVIDEFPYWIEREESIISELQYIWDELLKEKNIFLILCGSYVSIMEEKVLSKNSPLYGRRTGQLEVESMKIKHLRDFLPKYRTEELIKTYGAMGTVPFYLKEMDDSRSFLENIKNTFFNKANILNQEAIFLLKEELREVNVYFNILKAILNGATTITEISSRSRVDITNIHKYIATLIGLKLVKKIKPITSPAKERQYLLKIEDSYFRFWLTYVYPYQSEIEEDPDSLMKLVEKNYSSYMGFIFEDICRALVRNFNTGVATLGLEVGQWWYKDAEIDLVAVNNNTQEILCGECKWKDKVDASKVLAELKEKTKLVQWNNTRRKEHYVIFAKSFQKKIKEEGLTLLDLRDIDTYLRT